MFSPLGSGSEPSSRVLKGSLCCFLSELCKKCIAVIQSARSEAMNDLNGVCGYAIRN